MDEKSYGQVLRELAEKYVNEEGRKDVLDFIVDENHERAGFYILGAVDHLFGDKQIDGEEASGVYEKLGIPPKAMFKVRAGHNEL